MAPARTKLVSRCRWHKITTKFSGYFLDSAFNGCLVVEKTSRKSMVKRTLYKKKKNMNSAQMLTPNRLLWAGVWGKLQDVEVNFKNVEPNSFLWHGHPSPSYRILESLQRGIKPPGGFSISMRTALGDNCVSLLGEWPEKNTRDELWKGRDIKILKNLLLDLWNNASFWKILKQLYKSNKCSDAQS